jgi:D-alanyl-lipoteichoic acid acyltransferase DltB (MBOAT superfamily)
MLFNSIEYIFWFLPVAIVGYATVRHFSTAHSGIAFLSLASMVFYLWWDINNLGILIGAILVNFAFGRLMIRCQGRGGFALLIKKAALIAGITFNVGLLAYYKYANFFAEQASFEMAHIILPLGISFFTFQKITYLVDCFYGLLSEAGIVEFSLFVAYFPHAIAGPIVHHRDMMPQFLHPDPPLKAETMREGLFFFVVGLAKKVLIADSFALNASGFFGSVAASPENVHLFDAWQGVFAYAMQIYFDFSGYSDMAVGAALMMGIRLPLNFNSPYAATSVIEFWRRWHMTLSRFLKEYIYIPLGGSRCGSVRHYVNLMTVMLIGGFWHGAGWTFLVWGGLHGLYLLINHAWRAQAANFSRYIRLPSPLTLMFSWACTFFAICFAWAFFRADSLATAVAVTRGMLGLNGIALAERHRGYFGTMAHRLDEIGVQFIPDGDLNLHFIVYVYVLTAIVFCMVFPSTQALSQKLGAMPWRLNIALASVLGVAAGATICAMERPSEFLYFNF